MPELNKEDKYKIAVNALIQYSQRNDCAIAINTLRKLGYEAVKNKSNDWYLSIHDFIHPKCVCGHIINDHAHAIICTLCSCRQFTER